MAIYMLQQNNDFLLLEDGGKIILEPGQNTAVSFFEFMGPAQGYNNA